MNRSGPWQTSLKVEIAGGTACATMMIQPFTKLVGKAFSLPGLARIIATGFGLGLVPIAPGTAGSAGGLLIAYLLAASLGARAGWHPIYFGFLALIFLPIAIWAADVTACAECRKDPGLVVVDEVIGQWITLAGIAPGAAHLNWRSWTAGFVLFRIFDIWKPAPVRQLERLPGGMGIVADDAMAGIYGAVVLFSMGWFNFY
ncbi:MAG: phosphatidylglycerophosphatase A [Acidobacteriota bacterium]|nr:phosphatidylglycerophosphatase A [Acidobacteriota bacterium]